MLTPAGTAPTLTSRLRKAVRLYLSYTLDDSGTHIYVVHIGNLHCGRYVRRLIFVETHLIQGFGGSVHSAWKEQADSVLMIPDYFQLAILLIPGVHSLFPSVMVVERAC